MAGKLISDPTPSMDFLGGCVRTQKVKKYRIILNLQNEFMKNFICVEKIRYINTQPIEMKYFFK